MKIGFDNDKYLAMQSEHIRERIKKFDNKLYLEFGGKLFDDYHASRVLPGFAAGLQAADASAAQGAGRDRHRHQRRGHRSAARCAATYGITYDLDVLRLIDAFQDDGAVCGQCVRDQVSRPAAEVEAFEKRLEQSGHAGTFRHYQDPRLPQRRSPLSSATRATAATSTLRPSRPLVVVTAPGPGSGKMAACLSQLYHEHKRGVKAGYAKFETFPIWNLPLKHPVNLAYEAATADLNDVNMIDPYPSGSLRRDHRELQPRRGDLPGAARDVRADRTARAPISPPRTWA